MHRRLTVSYATRYTAIGNADVAEVMEMLEKVKGAFNRLPDNKENTMFKNPLNYGKKEVERP